MTKTRNYIMTAILAVIFTSIHSKKKLQQSGIAPEEPVPPPAAPPERPAAPRMSDTDTGEIVFRDETKEKDDYNDFFDQT